MFFTIFLAVVFCAAITLLLISAVAFVQYDGTNKWFFSSAPKEALELLKPRKEELMVLLHGGGTCYLGVLPTAKKIAEKYHVILPAYDGFNPSEPETEFRSVAWEARELEEYILQNYGGREMFLT